MRSYLQRLAARATGHTVSPSLIPPVRSEMTRESESDPFAAAMESYESLDAQSPQAVPGPQVTSDDAQVAPTFQYSSESVAPLAPVASALRSRHIRRSHAEEAQESAIDTQPASPESEAANSQRETSSREIDSQATSKPEPQKSKDKTRVRAEPPQTQIAGLDEKSRPMLSPVDAGEQSFTRKRETGDETESRRPNSQAQDVPQQLTPRTDATERSAATSPRAVRTDVTGESAPTFDSRRADRVQTPAPSPGMRDESSPTLEPRRADAVRSAASVSGLSDEPAPNLKPRSADPVARAAPLPDEPRLVIGQLRVDVVTAAPAQTREVVRVVTRTVATGRSSNTGGSLSKLRFGLGQM